MSASAKQGGHKEEEEEEEKPLDKNIMACPIP